VSTAGHHLHINAPELLSGRERTRDLVITAIMWSVYLYLWMPLISLFAWLFGFELAYDVMIRDGGVQHLGGVLAIYAGIVMAIFATVSLWSLGNLWRYGKLNRRARAEPTSIEAMAEYFDVDTEVIEQLRLTPAVSIEFGPDGHPVIKRYEAVTVSELTGAAVPVVPLGGPEHGEQAESKPEVFDPGRRANS
jgi:biofilm PGA synthesis protein PgaD